MAPDNSIKFSDIGILRLLMIIIPIQLAMIGLVALSSMGIEVPMTRPIVGFVYLTFVPGIMILRLLNVRGLDNQKYMLYSVGLSLSFIMACGFVLNFLLRQQFMLATVPITPETIATASALFIFAASAICFMREKDVSVPVQPRGGYGLHAFLNWSNVAVIILPTLAVFATYVQNEYRSNVLMILLLIVIAALIILAVLNRLPGKVSFTSLLFAIALSIVLLMSMVSTYPYGYNIDSEYFFSQKVIDTGIWDDRGTWSLDPVISQANTILSIVMIPPFYTLVLGMDTILVFKLVCPFFLALLPVSIYVTCREHLSDKASFAVGIFFLSLPHVTDSLLMFRREYISLLFLSLIILAIADRQLSKTVKTMLTIMFVLSIVVAYYGIALLSFLVFLVSLIIFNAEVIGKKIRHWNSTGKFKLSVGFPVAFLWFVFMILWYSSVSDNNTFSQFSYIFLNSLGYLSDFLAMGSRPSIVYSAMGIGIGHTMDITRLAYRMISYILEALMLTGFLALFFRKDGLKMNPEYRSLLVAATVFMALFFIMPNWYQNVDFFRMYSFSQVFISVFVVFGTFALGGIILHLLHRLGRARYRQVDQELCLKLLIILLIVPYLLYNMGVVNAVAQALIGSTTPISSSHPAIDRWNMDTLYFSMKDIVGEQWIAQSQADDAIVFCDDNSGTIINYGFWNSYYMFSNFNTTDLAYPPGYYIYFREWNTLNDRVLVMPQTGDKLNYVNVSDFPMMRNTLSVADVIYSNAGSKIYLTN